MTDKEAAAPSEPLRPALDRLLAICPTVDSPLPDRQLLRTWIPDLAQAADEVREQLMARSAAPSEVETLVAEIIHQYKHPSYSLDEYRCHCREDARLAIEVHASRAARPATDRGWIESRYPLADVSDFIVARLSESGSPVVREIRGRLFEAAWRTTDGREWLDPKIVSAILDDVDARLSESDDASQD